MKSEAKIRAVKRACEVRTERKISSITTSTPDDTVTGSLTVHRGRRRKRFQSIAEYSRMVADKQWTTIDFVKEGYSGKQITFFNWMIDGKCPLSKDEFSDLYNGQSIPLFEIADRHGISRDHIGYLRDYFGLKRIGATGLKRARETKPLTALQKSIAVGCLLGDAHIDGGGSLRIKHGDSQRAYAEHILSVFSQHGAKMDSSKVYDDRYEKLFGSHAMRTSNHREFKSLRSMIYSGGVKILTSKFLEMVDDVSLAYWFMDDGYTRVKDGELSEVRLYSCSFTRLENVHLAAFLHDRFGVDMIVSSKEVGKNYFLLGSIEATRRLVDIVRPHIIECMKYKVDPTVARREIPFLESIPTKTKYLALPEAERVAIVSSIVDMYADSGFPYVELTDEQIAVSINRIKNWTQHHLVTDQGYLKNNVASSSIITHHQRHMFNMGTRGSLTPIDIFEDRRTFADAIDRRLSYGGTCTPSGVRSVLKEYRNNRSVGSFLPSCAKAVMLLLGAGRNTRVLDFCAGFGGRLLGCCGAGVAEYTGIDPLPENCAGLSRMADYFPETDVRILNSCAEDALPNIGGGYDIVFTSPPYFDKEIYSQDASQSTIKFPVYGDWLSKWLFPVCREAMGKLKPDGSFAISIGKSDDHDIASDLIAELGQPDLAIPVETPVISYLRKNGAKKYEYVYVWRSAGG